MGRLSGRLRRQASSHNWTQYNREKWVGCQAAFAGKPRSHNWTQYNREKWVGCQAAFAGKPAPTIEPSTTGRNGSAGRPPSQACQLPQNQKQELRTPPAPHHSLGRALARLLLILLYPPLRRLSGGVHLGGGRVAPCGEAAHIERRSKRSRPEAMLPDEYRNEGTPSLSEG